MHVNKKWHFVNAKFDNDHRPRLTIRKMESWPNKPCRENQVMKILKKVVFVPSCHVFG